MDGFVFANVKEESRRWCDLIYAYILFFTSLICSLLLRLYCNVFDFAIFWWYPSPFRCNPKSLRRLYMGWNLEFCLGTFLTFLLSTDLCVCFALFLLI